MWCERRDRGSGRTQPRGGPTRSRGNQGSREGAERLGPRRERGPGQVAAAEAETRREVGKGVSPPGKDRACQQAAPCEPRSRLWAWEMMPQASRRSCGRRQVLTAGNWPACAQGSGQGPVHPPAQGARLLRQHFPSSGLSPPGTPRQPSPSSPGRQTGRQGDGAAPEECPSPETAEARPSSG